MREDLYNEAFDLLMQLEGYHSDHTADPGGRTIWGISERYFPEDVKKMAEMSPEEAKEYAKQFYAKRFWKEFDDPLLSAVSFLVAVNTAVPILKVQKEGGGWRDVLLEAVEYYCNLVEKRPSLRQFFRGWINRINTIYQFAKKREEKNEH